MVGDARKCKALTDALLHDYKFYLQPINFPTVPVGAERIRVTPGPFHTEEQLQRLTNAIDELWSKLDLPRVVASSLQSEASCPASAIPRPSKAVDDVIMKCVGHQQASPK
jgi:hypothetical protein